MSQTSFDKDKIKILLLEGVHASADRTLQRRRLRQTSNAPPARCKATICVECARPTCTCSASAAARSSPPTRSLQRAALIAVGCFCIGTNQVDLTAAMRGGVPVFNAPFSNTRSVAELVLAEAVLLLRGVPEKHGLLKQGVWQKSAATSLRNARQDARRRRLRQHRHAARRARRSTRDARAFYDVVKQAEPRQRAADRFAR